MGDGSVGFWFFVKKYVDICGNRKYVNMNVYSLIVHTYIPIYIHIYTYIYIHTLLQWLSFFKDTFLLRYLNSIIYSSMFLNTPDMARTTSKEYSSTEIVLVEWYVVLGIGLNPTQSTWGWYFAPMFYRCLYLAGVFLSTCSTILRYSESWATWMTCMFSGKIANGPKSGQPWDERDHGEVQQCFTRRCVLSWSCLVGDLVAITTMVDHHFSRFFHHHLGEYVWFTFFQTSKSRKSRWTEACLVYVFFISGARNSILRASLVFWF